MSKSLVEKAKKIKAGSKRRYDELQKDEIELALAWARGELPLRAVTAVLGKKSPNTAYSFLAHALRNHIKKS